MRRFIPQTLCALLVATVLTGFFFNRFALEVSNFNDEVRSWVVGNGWKRQEFSAEGIPYGTTPRHEERFVSPFYVVHYGLIYSEKCRSRTSPVAYHWLEDATVKDWPHPPGSSLAMFRSSADWVVRNIRQDPRGNAHLFYDFEWFYRGYPEGKLVPPWWSGLTDAHAITLLLRAEDCFGGGEYEQAASALYRSTITPVSLGGSLVSFNGRPWIEEYVDPRAKDTDMSRVFNGMAYAYFGLKAYEQAHGIDGLEKELRASIIANVSAFDRGYWSDYDAIGSAANIKYHRVNLALIEDPRLYSSELDGVIRRWSVGRTLSGFFFVLQGPASIGKWHFIATWALMTFVLWVALLAIIVIGQRAILSRRAGARRTRKQR